MKSRNGFTLIELLAVIVILAIIAVIAVPIVLNIIDESKENATLRSAEMYLDAVELSIANRVMHHGAIPNKAYPIMNSGNICLEDYVLENEKYICRDNDNNPNNNELEVEVNGEAPKSGTIIIENGQIVNELNIKAYLDAVKESIKNLSVEEYAIMNNGNLCTGTLESNTCTGDILPIEINIAKPNSGTIDKKNNNVTISGLNKNKTELVISDKTLVNNSKGELVDIKLLLCTANTTKAKALVYNSGDLGDPNSYTPDVPVGLLASDGNAFAKGVAYTCNFIDDNETNNMTFFVLSSTEDTVTLIAGFNLKALTGDVHTVAWSSDGNNHKDETEDKQAVTAKAALAERTSYWSSANGGKLSEEQMLTIKLPTKDQIEGAYEGAMPAWLNSCTETPVACGYWTSTPGAEDSIIAWTVDFIVDVGISNVGSGDVYGVRPVITISKSNV